MDIVARAKALEATGVDVVRLEIGDPDLPTPEVVKRAAEAAMDMATPATRSPWASPSCEKPSPAHYHDKYGVTVSPEDIVVTQGTSPAMLLLFGSLLDPGDEVIISDPCYPAYPNYIDFLGGTPAPVRVRAEEGFRFRPDEVRAAITERTRAIMINSPANPMGTTLGPDDLQHSPLSPRSTASSSPVTRSTTGCSSRARSTPSSSSPTARSSSTASPRRTR